MRHEEYMLEYTAPRDDEHSAQDQKFTETCVVIDKLETRGGMTRMTVEGRCIPLDSGWKVMGKSWEIHDFWCHFSLNNSKNPISQAHVWRGWVLNGFKHIKH
jgi:hypothetical protein